MSETPSAPTAAFIIIGNEILSGRTKDANLAYVGERLAALGILLQEARVIPDVKTVIVATVNELRARHTYVFTSGGIGPTHDDITTDCVATAFGLSVVRDPVAEAALRRHYKAEDLNAARLKMADVPEGARLIENPVSAAPGFQVENVFVLAGVPRIMQAQFESAKDRLAGGAPMLSRTLVAFVTEGSMAAELSRIQDGADGVEIGSYPFVRDGRLGTSIVMRGTDDAALSHTRDLVAELMRKVGGEPTEEGLDDVA
ncbi:MAG: competence/damage-inducible protein A [Rhodospirillales bacterium]